eukprot:3732941-Rhodomonas_salina.1
MYVKGRFWFDLVTSMPISWVSWAGRRNCDQGSTDSVQSSDAADALRFIRVVKPLRIVKVQVTLQPACITEDGDLVVVASPGVV